MIDFADLSLWNTAAQAKECMKDKIVALKASEGGSIQDPQFLQRVKLYADKPVIAYHFCRLDRNEPEVEVNKFLSVCKKAERPLVLALDFEGPCQSNKHDLDRLVKMVDLIRVRTGKEPYIYINESMLTKAKRLGYNFSWLWIAKWSSYKPKYDCGIWQFTNRWKDQNLDGNHFMVDDIELLKRHEVKL